MSFGELLGEVRRTALEAYEHQEVPFEKLVEELSPQRSLNTTPVFQAQIVMQNMPLAPIELEGLYVEPIKTNQLRARFDPELNATIVPPVSLIVVERYSQVALTWVYNPNLFDHWRMKQMTRHYVHVLEGVAGHEDR